MASVEILNAVSKIDESMAPPIDSLSLIQQSNSKTSSVNDRGLHVEITNKLESLNLKSPKPQKDMGWRGLVDLALGLDDLEEEEPFIPSKEKENEMKVAPQKMLSDQDRLTDLGESPNRHIKHKISSYNIHRYDPHEPHSAQIKMPDPENLLNFSDLHSPDTSHPVGISIPETNELVLLEGMEDSLQCDEKSNSF